MSHYIETELQDKLAKANREIDRLTALVEKLCVARDNFRAFAEAWAELAVARGRLIKTQGGAFGKGEVVNAEDALVKLGVSPEAL